jgi:hypothetical protein
MRHAKIATFQRLEKKVIIKYMMDLREQKLDENKSSESRLQAYGYI